MKNKIGILSLGCPRNIVDSESILGRLNLKGYDIVEINKAQIGIVNTCAFIEDAKRESIDAILDLIALKKEGRLKKIIVCGCLPQRYREKLTKELPEIDAFVGRISLNHSLNEFSITPKHYAYLKICEGCVNNCSYCVIPQIKGRFTSLKKESILSKVERLDQEGISELNIIGQDITGFGLDLYGRRALPELLEKIIQKAAHIRWIRLLYLYPHKIIEPLLDVIKDNPQVCKYIDLPVQHINERILKLMNRNISKTGILKLIGKIRKKIPEGAVRTSVIAGFPSETEKEFKELLKFIEDMKFERLGAFIYSREEGTAAYNFKKQIPKTAKIERFNAIMSKQQEISRGINEKFLGETIEVLIDAALEKDTYPDVPTESSGVGIPPQKELRVRLHLGRSRYDAPEVDGCVYVRSKEKLNPGEFVKVKITDTLEYDLVGEALR